MDLIQLAQDILGPIVSHQATQFGFAFGLAAMLHARQVRKEIAIQMGGLSNNVSSSIDEVTKVLREDLGKQSERLKNVESGVQNLNNRVEKLETKKE